MQDNEHICRLCLSPTNKQAIELYQDASPNLSIIEIIKSYINIEIIENDKFSNLICESCAEKLNNFHNYVLFVKRNNEVWTENESLNSIKWKDNENSEQIETQTSNCENEISDIEQVYIKEDLSENEQDCELNDCDDNDDELFDDNEATDNISNVEPQIIINDFTDSKKNIGKKKQKVTNFPETANDVQIKKFYKYECDLCKDHAEILTFRSFKLHYKIKHGIAAYIKCCGKIFKRPYALVEHIDEHLVPDSLVCPTCNKKLRTKQTLLLHMDKHVPIEQRPLKCSYCDLRFVRKHFLIQHERVHLSDDQLKYICDLCGKRYPTDWRLKTHLNSTHSDERPFVCEICARTFKLKVQLKNHMYTHNSKEEVYKQCEICGIWLRSPKSYYTHMKEKHDESTPKRFPCDKCTHISPTRKALYAHRINKHGPKKLNCTYCTEAFSSSNLLKSHMIKHTGPGEPLKCPYCPKTFSFRSGYYSHKKKAHSNMIESTNTNK